MPYPTQPACCLPSRLDEATHCSSPPWTTPACSWHSWRAPATHRLLWEHRQRIRPQTWCSNNCSQNASEDPQFRFCSNAMQPRLRPAVVSAAPRRQRHCLRNVTPPPSPSPLRCSRCRRHTSHPALQRRQRRSRPRTPPLCAAASLPHRVGSSRHGGLSCPAANCVRDAAVWRWVLPRSARAYTSSSLVAPPAAAAIVPVFQRLLLAPAPACRPPPTCPSLPCYGDTAAVSRSSRRRSRRPCEQGL